MREFDHQLLRLKQTLGETEDQAIAAALGMSKAAFADRKKRDAFPVDKLKALASDNPALRIDVGYVLTGESNELERRLYAVKKATRIASGVRDGDSRAAVQDEVFRALVDALSEDEQRLVSYYRSADAQGKAVLLSTASLLANAQPAKPKRKGAK